MLSFRVSSFYQKLNLVYLPKQINPKAVDLYSFVRIYQEDRHRTLFEMVYTNALLRAVYEHDVNDDHSGGDPGQVFLLFSKQVKEHLEPLKGLGCRCLLKEVTAGAKFTVVNERGAKHQLVFTTYTGNSEDFAVKQRCHHLWTTLCGAELAAACASLQSVVSFEEDKPNSPQEVFTLRLGERSLLISSKRTLAAVIHLAGTAEPPLELTISGMYLEKLRQCAATSATVSIYTDGVKPQWVRFVGRDFDFECLLPKLRSNPIYLIELKAGRYEEEPENGVLCWRRCVNLDDLIQCSQLQAKVGEGAKNLILAESAQELVLVDQEHLDGKNESRLPIRPDAKNIGDFQAVQVAASVLTQTLKGFFRGKGEEEKERLAYLSLWRFPRPRNAHTRWIYFVRLERVDTTKLMLMVTVMTHALEGADTSD